jgi:hypothetical protein
MAKKRLTLSDLLGVDLDPEERLEYGAPAFTVTFRAGEELIDYGGGEYHIPRRFVFTFKYSEDSSDETLAGVVVTVEFVIERKELVCEFIGVRRGSKGRSVSTTLWRKISPKWLKEEVAGPRAAFKIGVVEPGEKYSPHVPGAPLKLIVADARKTFLSPVVLSDKAGWLEAYTKEAHLPQRGKRLSDAHFKKVADIYREAAMAGQAPTQAIAEAFPTSRSNAGRWVMEARRRGFLGEAPAPGKAGEKEKRRATAGARQREKEKQE